MSSNFHPRAGAPLGALGLLAAATAAQADDLLTAKPPPAPVVDNFQPFFVKVGFTYALNTSLSHLWGQSPTALAQGVTTAFPTGVGATLTDEATVSFVAGVFITRNISLDVGGGIPFYIKDKTRGYNPANPVLVNGTTLAQIMPAIVPITVLYHFDNFGPISPYIGGGLAPAWSFSNKNAFLSDIHVSNSLGPVIQAGVVYMIDRNWGVNLDVRKTFNYVQSNANWVNMPGYGPFPAKTFQHTNFEPWLFSLGLVYRFGAGEPLLAKY